MRDDLSAFLRHLGGYRSPNTTKTYEATLVAFFRFAAARGVEGVPGRADVEAFLGRPRGDGARRAASSWNRALAALRAFVKFARRDVGWTVDPTEGIPFLREPERDPVFLTAFELRRLFQVVAASDDDLERARDTAIVALLAHAGLRVHELVALDFEQVDIATATLVGVQGKGGTLHALPLNAPTLALLGNWLAVRKDVAPEDGPALFVTPRGGRLSIRSVQRLLVRLRKAIGTAKKLTPHALRHVSAHAPLHHVKRVRLQRSPASRACSSPSSR
jgi:integrase/recombinase XerC